MRFGVFGDVHGRQELMYIAAEDWQERNGKKLDAILQVGDFETIRSERDLEHYYAPRKYHHISEISDYCKGLRKAPFFTAFIGGNHEAWGVLKSHHKGGFICPRVYYLGRSNVIDINGVRIGGLTGIFGRKYYKKEFSPNPSYDWKYYRKSEVAALEKKIEEKGGIDILLIHDWVKPVSRIEVVEERNVTSAMKKSTLVSPTYPLIERFQPQYVFMGHMHRRTIRGRIGSTEVHGLAEFRGDGEQDSFKVIEVPSLVPQPQEHV